ncbi:cytochrome c oxidase subunit 3 family protein [Mycolicibacterium insubricum]|nr:cytochrome c oxidase subunit 3 family protein [Mycolicibacterium insubricum]
MMAPLHMASSRPQADEERRQHIPGEPGLWVLLFADLTVFGALFIVYLVKRGQEPELFAESQALLNRNSGAINTLILLTSSVLIVFAFQTLQSRGPGALASRLLFSGILIGACFVVVKAIEYQEKFAAGITWNTNNFFMYYFVLTGLHLAHVLVGLGVLMALLPITRGPSVTSQQVAFFEGSGCFWHMVDLLWIVIFPLVFLVR